MFGLKRCYHCLQESQCAPSLHQDHICADVAPLSCCLHERECALQTSRIGVQCLDQTGVVNACRKVNVRHIRPGSKPPTDADFWWDQEHDRRFFSFIDKFPEGLTRSQPQANPQALRVTPLPCKPPTLPIVIMYICFAIMVCRPTISLSESISCPLLWLPHGIDCACAHVQVLHCADFYAGCGGLSFLDQQTPEVHITTAWAVDFCESMTLSFRANYPDAHVSHCCSCCMCLSSWNCACCLGYTDNAAVTWTAYVF